MTCVAGLIAEKSVVHLAGDRCLSDGEDGIFIYTEPKVFRVDKFIIGFAGTLSTMQAVQYRLQAPIRLPTGDADWFGFMVVEFAGQVRKALAEIEDPDPSMLVGVAGQLFTIDGSYGVVRHEQFAAIGSGMTAARASLASTRGDPENRLRIALQIASDQCAGVRPPFDFISTE